jgi:hypothetical protein
MERGSKPSDLELQAGKTATNKIIIPIRISNLFFIVSHYNGNGERKLFESQPKRIACGEGRQPLSTPLPPLQINQI